MNPTRLVLPHDAEALATWPTALSYLLARFPEDEARLLAKVAAGEVVDGGGAPIDATTPLVPRGFLYLYRDPPADEPVVPELADLRVLYRDQNLLVVDKPHGVSVLPRGRWVTQTALVHLRRELDLPELSPVHRLDRLTAGVLVFTVRAEVRGAYQLLFERREVEKEYLAVAGLGGLAFPVTVRNRLVKRRGVVAAMPEPGEPNAESVIDLIARDDERGLGLYRLTPHTGKTHQLRQHMASLGLPILHDPFAGFWAPSAQDDEEWLQLLARRLRFVDPFTGERREFVSKRSLSEWSQE